MFFLNKQRSKINFQTLFLILFGLFFLYQGIPSLHKRISWCDGYALGDWLINYEDGGFKRRGLSGAFFIFLARFSGIYIGKIVFGFISLLYVSFITMLIYYFRKIKFDFYLLLFFLLPTTLLFPLIDFYAFGRKEIMLFNIFLFFLISNYKTDIYSWRYVILLSFMILITTLFHELTVFYIPYILLIYFKNYLELKKGNLLKIIVIGASTFIPALIIFIFGAEINEGNSWNILKKLGVGTNVLNGIFNWPKEGFGSGKVNALTFAKSRNYELYGISYCITIIIFFIVYIKSKCFHFSFKKMIGIHLLLIISSFPLFFLTIDWGRWINIHFICMLFVTAAYYPTLEKESLFSIKSLMTKGTKIPNLIKVGIAIILIFGFTMEHVENGFKIGQNNLLMHLRDLFWEIRHYNF